jgi:hypothetical protein
MMKFLFPLTLLCVVIPMSSRAAPISVSGGAQIEPVTSFTVQELWNATTPTSFEFGTIEVTYRMIDQEAPISRGKWVECGMVMIGNGDVATRPVAFRVWTKQACDLSMQKAKKNESPGQVRFNFFVNSAAAIPIQVSSELVVTVSGIRIGRIGTYGKE